MPNGLAQATAPSTDVVRQIVSLACQAPSMHNSQPWRWRLDGASIELLADPARQVAHADPGGRNLTISCGAALHHAQVAARALGWATDVDRFPEGHRADLLARLTLHPRFPGREDRAAVRSLMRRRTDRRRFTSWPVPRERLLGLVDAAKAWGGHAVPIVTLVDHFRVEHLVARAFEVQAADADLRAEHTAWQDRATPDGVPTGVVPADDGLGPGRAPRFAGGTLPDIERDLTGVDAAILLCGTDDDRPSWLATGEALAALWLEAVRDGLSVVPLSQVIEVPETRAALKQEILLGTASPHLLLRVGWQAIGRSQLPATPRRPLDDVLVS